MPKDKIPMVLELGKKFKDFGRNLLKHKVKVVFASDYVGEFADAERARRYELWWRTQTFDSNFEVLKQLTSILNRQLFRVHLFIESPYSIETLWHFMQPV